jgi:hypothetical protein
MPFSLHQHLGLMPAPERPIAAHFQQRVDIESRSIASLIIALSVEFLRVVQANCWIGWRECSDAASF